MNDSATQPDEVTPPGGGPGTVPGAGGDRPGDPAAIRGPAGPRRRAAPETPEARRARFARTMPLLHAGRRRATEAGLNFSVGRRQIDVVLTEADRAAYLRLLRSPGCTARAAHRWLADHGYRVSGHAVRQYLQRFRQRLDLVRRTSEMAVMFAEAAREQGAAAAVDAAAALAEQAMVRAMYEALDAEAGAAGGFDPARWRVVFQAIGEAVRTRGGVEALRATGTTGAAAARAAAAAAARADPDPDPDPARVALAVRQALGIPDPPAGLAGPAVAAGPPHPPP